MDISLLIIPFCGLILIIWLLLMLPEYKWEILGWSTTVILSTTCLIFDMWAASISIWILYCILTYPDFKYIK